MDQSSECLVFRLHHIAFLWVFRSRFAGHGDFHVPRVGHVRHGRARSFREDTAAIGGNAGGTRGGSLKMPEVEMNQKLHV